MAASGAQETVAPFPLPGLPPALSRRAFAESRCFEHNVSCQLNPKGRDQICATCAYARKTVAGL
jgi:hypothetical protein